jgi:hypothetical protein
MMKNILFSLNKLNAETQRTQRNAEGCSVFSLCFSVLSASLRLKKSMKSHLRLSPICEIYGSKSVKSVDTNQ